MFVPAHRIETAPDATPSRTAFVLHGILGSKRNWRTFARRIVRRWPDWRLVLVDHRHHGESDAAPGENTLAACGDDLARLADEVGAPELVMGHSFGGKVALTYARDHGSDLDQVWVLDAIPGTADPSGDVAEVIAALRRIPTPIDRREALVETLTDMGFSEMLGRWMTTNLERDEAGYTWRFDLDAVEELIGDYWRTDLWPVIEDPPCGIHLVRAGRSDRWTDDDVERLRAAGERVHLHTLEDAGHWVHVDDPDGLLDLLAAGFGAG